MYLTAEQHLESFIDKLTRSPIIVKPITADDLTSAPKKTADTEIISLSDLQPDLELLCGRHNNLRSLQEKIASLAIYQKSTFESPSALEAYRAVVEGLNGRVIGGVDLDKTPKCYICDTPLFEAIGKEQFEDILKESGFKHLKKQYEANMYGIFLGKAGNPGDEIAMKMSPRVANIQYIVAKELS
jgi:hypothetical protein